MKVDNYSFINVLDPTILYQLITKRITDTKPTH